MGKTDPLRTSGAWGRSRPPPELGLASASGALTEPPVRECGTARGSSGTPVPGLRGGYGPSRDLSPVSPRRQ